MADAGEVYLVSGTYTAGVEFPADQTLTITAIGSGGGSGGGAGGQEGTLVDDGSGGQHGYPGTVGAVETASVVLNDGDTITVAIGNIGVGGIGRGNDNQSGDPGTDATATTVAGSVALNAAPGLGGGAGQSIWDLGNRAGNPGDPGVDNIQVGTYPTAQDGATTSDAFGGLGGSGWGASGGAGGGGKGGASGYNGGKTGSRGGDGALGTVRVIWDDAPTGLPEYLISGKIMPMKPGAVIMNNVAVNQVKIILPGQDETIRPVWTDLAPPAVTAFTASDTETGQVTCTWTDVTTGVGTRYNLWVDGIEQAADIASPYVHTIAAGTYSFLILSTTPAGTTQGTPDSGTSL